MNKNNFKFSPDKDKVEQKIFELRNIDFDIFENGDDYVLYEIKKIDQRQPDLNDNQTKSELLELIFQKNVFEFNRNLLERINNKEFNNNDFMKMSQNNIESIKLISPKDNKKFEINAVEILYSLPVNSFTLINDEQKNIYLAKVKRFQNNLVNLDENQLKDYMNKQNSNIKNNMLKSYDLYLNNKYEVVLNKKTIERVKNFFQ